jgi:hypothetical protein
MLDVAAKAPQDDSLMPQPSLAHEHQNRGVGFFPVRLRQIWSGLLQKRNSHSSSGGGPGKQGILNFYYPQRLWIAFGVTNVGLVFLLIGYYFLLGRFRDFLNSFRMQVSEVLSQSNSFVAAAPGFLEQMTKFSVPESLKSTYPSLDVRV